MHPNEVNLLALTDHEYAALLGEAGKLGPAHVKALAEQEKRQARQAD